MRTFILAVVLILLVAWAATAVVMVDETEYAVVTRFGRPVQVVLDAGLRWKWPAPFESVLRFDKRVQVLETPAPLRPYDEFLTRDKKNVVLGTYTAWRIARGEQTLSRFLQTVWDIQRADVHLADVVVSELGAALGQHDFSALVTTDEQLWKWPELTAGILGRCRERAVRDYGIEVVDFQITRLGFPDQNRRSVFERMRAERERIATQYRSEGDAEARKIRAEARKEESRILAEADEQALRIRGDAEAEATRLYAETYGQDAAFFEFVRSLDTYQRAFDENTVLILSADSPLMKLLTQPGTPSVTPPAASQPVW